VKIVFTGPECSGKTTLAQLISHKYNLKLIPEVARAYLDMRMNVYDESSLYEIASLQQGEENDGIQKHKSICCDTDLLTIIIWQNEKYGNLDQNFFNNWRKSKVDMFFLCTPDFPWEYDPQRENPDDRHRLFNIYLDFLNQSDHPFCVLEGPLNQRIESVEKILPTLFL
jgi:nicotinamide riboside kinase